jgi:integrase
MRVSLFIKLEKTTKIGNAPIIINVSFRGERLKFSSGESCYPKNWDKKKERVKSGEMFANAINLRLQQMITKINEWYRDIQDESAIKIKDFLKENFRKTFPVQNIKDESEVKSKILTFKDLALKLQEANDGLKSKNYLRVFNQVADHFEKYVPKLAIDKINYQVLSGFIQYLFVEVGLENNTVAGHLKKIRAVFQFGKKLGLSLNFDFDNFSLKYIDKEIIFLTEEELLQLEKYQPSTNRLQHIKDVFLFGCYTGLRFSDLENLSTANFKENLLEYRPIKTPGKLVVIPLIQKALEVLEKYKDNTQTKLLPTISSGNSNFYLKELAQKANLNSDVLWIEYRAGKRIETICKKYEILSMHDSRHTFACLSLMRGVDVTVVSSMLGHANIGTTMKHYLNITNAYKSDQLLKAWDK